MAGAIGIPRRGDQSERAEQQASPPSAQTKKPGLLSRFP